jgi:NADH-quinone oxidoreductase subunit G/[NiFe] hydrogenase diaphorase moiety small subunit
MSNETLQTQEIGGQINVTVDGKRITVQLGETILEALRRHNIKIPTLCYHEDLCISGSCRLCMVEFEDTGAIQTACTYPVTQSIKIKTTSPRIRQARRDILSLILRDHHAECTTCPRNGTCELQALAKEYGVADYPFGRGEKKRARVYDGGPIIRDMDKCIQCFRCVRTCQELQSVGALGKLGRGDDVHVSTFMDHAMLDALCVGCGQCINRCPVGALTERDDVALVWEAIDDPRKHVVIQTAPAPRAAIGECFDQPPGKCYTKELNTALKRIGFDKVFDTNFTADLTIMEEGTELLLRLKKALVDKQPVSLPQITSCSPGWIKFVEQVKPDLLDHISSCKSPQQMFGAIIKTHYADMNHIDPSDIVTVSLMPCTAKKFECERPEMGDSGYKDVDIVLTTREMARMIKQAGIDLPNLEGSEFDEPLGLGSGAGQIFGATGGVMEAAIRTAYEIVTGEEVPFEQLRIEPVRGMEGIRQAELPITKAVADWKFLEGATLKVMVAHGLSNARLVLEKLAAGALKDVHFIEIMACPGGCLGGGGQPIPTTPDIRKARARAIYEEDEGMPLRKSHDNPIVQRLYKEFLSDGPCGHKSHKLLHTHYLPRGSRIV